MITIDIAFSCIYLSQVFFLRLQLLDSLGSLRNGLHPGSQDLVDVFSVGDQDAVRLEPLSACVAGVGPFPGVLPLVRHQRHSSPQLLVAETALELSAPVAEHVLLQPVLASEPLVTHLGEEACTYDVRIGLVLGLC